MRIAIYTPSWPPGSAANGVATYTSYLVPALRALGHTVYVITQRRTEGECSDPYTLDLGSFGSAPSFWDRALYRIAPEGTFFRARTSALIKAIQRLKHEYNVEVLEMEESFGWAFALSHLNLLPVVVRLHGPWFLTGHISEKIRSSTRDSRRQRLEGKSIKFAHYVTSPTAQVLEAVKARYRITRPRTRVIYNPIECSDKLSDGWNLDACDRNVLLFVGRFDELKGADLVLRAFARLSAMDSNLKLVFVGPDRGLRIPSGETITYEQFVQTTLPERCKSSIEYHGTLSHFEVMRLRKRAFVTISASRYEVLPYSILEAMSLGCPLIASAVGGIPEVIRDSANGLLVKPNDVTSLVVACRRLLDAPHLATNLGGQARQDCKQFFDPRKIAIETADAYREAIRFFESHSEQE